MKVILALNHDMVQIIDTYNYHLHLVSLVENILGPQINILEKTFSIFAKFCF